VKSPPPLPGLVLGGDCPFTIGCCVREERRRLVEDDGTLDDLIGDDDFGGEELGTRRLELDRLEFPVREATAAASPAVEEKGERAARKLLESDPKVDGSPAREGLRRG